MAQLELIFRDFLYCKRCRQSFPAKDFKKYSGSGYYSHCPDCREYFREKMRERRERKKLFGQPLYYDLHKERQKAYRHKYYTQVIKPDPHKYGKYLEIIREYHSRPEIKEKNRLYKRYRYHNIDIAYCPVCKKYKPATSEYFLERRGSTSGIFPLCRDCSISKYNQDYFWGEVNFNNRYRRIAI